MKLPFLKTLQAPIGGYDKNLDSAPTPLGSTIPPQSVEGADQLTGENVFQ